MLGDDVKLVGREEVLTDVENCLCPLLHTFPLSFFLYYIWWFGIFSGTGTFRFQPRPFFSPHPTPSHSSATKGNHLLTNVRQHSFFMSTVS
jgi:hypothetical protein